ncbi:hypothetical protein ABID21_003518 [Pseudorhizobium tarimense]|uniref:Uncharacterized protein n=1 Tax=Pseudorhizobium tarimense TaxID=1079109 RepID=A0ABV2HA16_9HYPH|nr:hypothetical protein [Pseudorhizobium tarimense]MCJ8520598.1 hypothetical protein [Pseudorhizobium tarimense]
MTLVLSVSANTAAYAAEALKPARRLSAKAQAEDIRLTADRGALRAETGDATVDQLIPAAAVNLDLLSPEQQPHQRATLAQVQAAYRDIAD